MTLSERAAAETAGMSPEQVAAFRAPARDIVPGGIGPTLKRGG